MNVLFSVDEAGSLLVYITNPIVNLKNKSHTIKKSPASGGFCECGRIRTFDQCLKRALLYQLSYAPVFEIAR